MRRAAGIFGALALGVVLAAPVLAGGIGPIGPANPANPQITPPAIPNIPLPKTVAPDLHSYQPYSGLQYGFRPEPPGQRRVRPPEEVARDAAGSVIMPVQQAPLIPYGKGHAGAGVLQGYTYCSPGQPCP